jgi:subtilisin family serine protease
MKRFFYSVLLIAFLIGFFQPGSAVAVSRTGSGANPPLRPGPGWVANEVAADGDPAIYIVVFQEPALAIFQGGVAGLAPTNPEARGEARLQADSPDSLAYLAYLDQQQAMMLAQIEAAAGRTVEIVFRYRAALNGVAARLTPGEAAAVASLPGVAHVERQTILHPLTDNGPDWMGAPGIWNGSSTAGLSGTQGEGVVVGIIDTGVNTDHPSFADIGPVDGYNHNNPRLAHYGVCAPQNPLLCNDKLIGLYDFTGTGPEDDVLHGSHVASTVAGNRLDARLIAPTMTYERTISGVAPHANIISYKVCSSLEYPELGACPVDAILAGIDQATLDLVDVINFSIGGGPGEPWTDPLALAFFGSRAAGIFVATSAGNNGPGENTVGRPANAPWVTSVAASTHDRKLINSLVNMSGGAAAAPADIEGKSLTTPYGPALIVYAGNYGDALCQNPFPAGTWTQGEIVVCDRGVAGRVQKSFNVAAGGAGGFVLANDAPSGDSLVADSYALPGVQIGFTAGSTLKNWLTSGSGHTASISGTTVDIDPVHGDIMAGFSSRGPNGPAPDIIKPDITAPGADIFAAFHTPDPLNPGPDEYGIISGTSMSSPHLAGSATLLRALHPDWSPDQVRSALMTTAFTTPQGEKEVHPVLKEDGVTPADPFDTGAGRVDLSRAGRAGLLLDESITNYSDANPDLGGTPKDLNLPSLAENECAGQCSWTRVLESAAGGSVTWTVAVQGQDQLAVTVTPGTFTLGSGETQAIEVTADVSALETLNRWYFAQITLVPDDPAIPEAHLPLAVFATGGGVNRETLFFHGNVHDGCTGNGAEDILACDGPFLSPDPALDSSPAAKWGPLQTAFNGNTDRNIYDANWVWHLDTSTTLDGPMTLEWWYACPGCNLLLFDDFNIRLWADGVLVLQQVVRQNVSLPGIPRLLTSTVNVPAVTASQSFVVHIDPVFVNQNGSLIFYDSSEPCPGSTAGEACSSRALMPVTGTGTPPPPVMAAPVQNPIQDDATPDQENGIDKDGSYLLSWDYPAPPAEPACGFSIEEATAFGTPFSDDAEEPLLLGSNSTWSGSPDWNSAAHPGTLSQGYNVLYTDGINASLAMVAPVEIPAGTNATLSFDSFENIEAGFDYGYVEVSADEGPYTVLAAYSGLFTGVRTVDLSSFAGQAIKVRFRFQADELVFFGVGWAIDNIQIDADNFTEIGVAGGSASDYEVTGRSSGTYSYRITALGGDCSVDPVAGPPSNVESISVEVPEMNTGSATGGGWLDAVDGKKINFGFEVDSSAGSPSGELELNDKAAGAKIRIDQITSFGSASSACGSVPAGDHAVQFAGNGTFNGAAASFLVCAQDNGEPGHSRASSNPDLFYLTCTEGCSYDTDGRTADSAIDGGNIDVLVENGGGAGDGIGGEPQASTMILDPLLLTEGVAGQLQTYTVRVFDQDQEAMTGVSVTLTRTKANGMTEKLTALTDLAGQAVFTWLNLSEQAELIGSAGSAESNAIELTPLLSTPSLP